MTENEALRKQRDEVQVAHAALFREVEELRRRLEELEAPPPPGGELRLVWEDIEVPFVSGTVQLVGSTVPELVAAVRRNAAVATGDSAEQWTCSECGEVGHRGLRWQHSCLEFYKRTAAALQSQVDNLRAQHAVARADVGALADALEQVTMTTHEQCLSSSTYSAIAKALARVGRWTKIEGA